MMIRAVQPFFDLKRNRGVHVGDEFDTDAERAAELVKNGFCEPLTTTDDKTLSDDATTLKTQENAPKTETPKRGRKKRTE